MSTSTPTTVASVAFATGKPSAGSEHLYWLNMQDAIRVYVSNPPCTLQSARALLRKLHALSHQSLGASATAGVFESRIDQFLADQSHEYLHARRFIMELELALTRHLVTEPADHPDDAAVDRFAAALKAKLARSRAKGRGGWEDKTQCPDGRLQRMLAEHIAKGDPLDVGALAMMIWSRAETTDAACGHFAPPQAS